ncbi:MAG: hypothetical protein ACK44D_10065 [Bacteroidia bacterium]
MSNNILFIFEGGRAEEQIVSNLQKFFVNENTIIKCVFGGEIYQMYKKIVEDQDLDTFNLIKERNTETREILSGYNRNDFAEIYLFFDYDGHSDKADDGKLKELIDFFKEETDKGKLYVSYPMVEALKHISDYELFKDLTVKCKDNIGYKNIVSQTALNKLNQINNYDLDTWKNLIIAHLKKANFISYDEFELPNDLISQIIIFYNQLEKYIYPYSIVSVLSAFPIFLNDYYGNEEIRKRIEK